MAFSNCRTFSWSAYPRGRAGCSARPRRALRGPVLPRPMASVAGQTCRLYRGAAQGGRGLPQGLQRICWGCGRVETARQELDAQLANTFAALGVLTKNVDQCQAQSRVHLRELRAGQERYIFTLIHKFSTERGELMPVLSERSDIIVITDEAHRSQYDQLAANMRRTL